MIATVLCLLCLAPAVVMFCLNGGKTDIPRSPRVGP
jgi:hypothetical protein